MSSCLIMFTNTFPFAGGEYFIENEIARIAEEFDKVFIFALDCNAGDEITRSVPQNVTAFNTATSSKSKLRLGDLIRAGFSSLLPCTEYREETKNLGKSFRRRVFWNFFEAQAKRKSREVTRLLSDFDLSGFDEVVLYSYWFFVTARVAAMQAKLLKEKKVNVTRTVSRAHRYDIYEYRNKLKFLPRREFLLNELDAVMPCSHDGTEHLRRKFAPFSEKIIYAPLGTPDRGKTLQSGEEFMLVSCSTLAPVKRVEKIVDTLALYDGERKINWVHMGGEGGALKKLKAYADERLKNVKFELKGQLKNSEVCRFYSENPVSLFLNVSESEGVPVSIMEAMSFAVPIIATNVGGNSETVENGVNGKLIDKLFTAEELLSEIEAFAQMPQEELKAFAENSRRLWQERYNADENYDYFVKLIRGEK